RRRRMMENTRSSVRFQVDRYAFLEVFNETERRYGRSPSIRFAATARAAGCATSGGTGHSPRCAGQTDGCRDVITSSTRGAKAQTGKAAGGQGRVARDH